MSFESQLRDLLGREPALVKVRRRILATSGYWLEASEQFPVLCVEPDRQGIAVLPRWGKSVSLHPSEYEVLEWRYPHNFSP